MADGQLRPLIRSGFGGSGPEVGRFRVRQRGRRRLRPPACRPDARVARHHRVDRLAQLVDRIAHVPADDIFPDDLGAATGSACSVTVSTPSTGFGLQRPERAAHAQHYRFGHNTVMCCALPARPTRPPSLSGRRSQKQPPPCGIEREVGRVARTGVLGIPPLGGLNQRKPGGLRSGLDRGNVALTKWSAELSTTSAAAGTARKRDANGHGGTVSLRIIVALPCPRLRTHERTAQGLSAAEYRLDRRGDFVVSAMPSTRLTIPRAS